MPSSLLLVDALGLAYRSFHAIGVLTNAAGQQTQAVYGVIKTLAQMERVWHPSHRLVVFDGGLPPDRLALCPDYKAQRPAMPPDLRSQLPLLEAWLEAASIDYIRRERMEADDVLATVAARAARAGFDVLLASSDKDLLQVVGPGVSVIAPGHVEERIGPAEVQARTGVRPDQIVDWLALTGDQADNIRGVPGIGPKTAARLLVRWPTLAELLAHLDEVEPEKTRVALSESRALLARNERLLRLRTDLEGLPDPERLRARAPDARRLLEVYETLNFQSLARALREPTLF